MTRLSDIEAAAKWMLNPNSTGEAKRSFHEIANPATILEMVALIRQMGEALKGVVGTNFNNWQEIDAARAALAKWEE